MKFRVPMLICLLHCAAAFCWAGEPRPRREYPAVDTPEPFRQDNYAGGSCGFASTSTMLRWFGQYEAADWVRQNYSGGCYTISENRSNSVPSVLRRLGLNYAYTDDADPRWLEWAVRNRYMVVIGYHPNHIVNLVDFNDREAVLLNNNHTDRYEHIPRDEFLRAWRSYGGDAITIVGLRPPPPLPRVGR